MIEEGVDAPAVALPAYVDGERRTVDLGEYIGEGIVVIAFYPADFNPACTMQTADLGDLDLFTMQKDVSVFGVSPDSTYSHEAFAERYSLNVPLLSDRDGEAARAYDVEMDTDDGESLSQRAVFVVDHRGVVEYAWATDDLTERPDVEPVKRAVGDIGGDDTALERYRVGHDDYVEGRKSFTRAMGDYEDYEWMDARNGFEAAEEAFASAADHLDTAVRFAESDDFETVVDRVEEKADTLRHAAEWLAESADAYASGSGKRGQQYRQDADPLLEAAKDLPEPAPPEQFHRTEEGIELADAIVLDPDDGEEGYAWRADDDSGDDATLGIDDAELDAAADAADTEGNAVGQGDSEGDAVDGDVDVETVESGGVPAEERADGSAADGPSDIEGDTVEGDLEVNVDGIDAAEGDDSVDVRPGRTDGVADDRASDTVGIDAEDPDTSARRYGDGRVDDGTDHPDGDGATAPHDSGADADANVSGAGDDDGDGDEDPVELDLADPTDGDADDDEDEADDERADWDIPGQ